MRTHKLSQQEREELRGVLSVDKGEPVNKSGPCHDQEPDGVWDDLVRAYEDHEAGGDNV